MTSDATPAPGSLTVPPLHGWAGIVVLLLAVVVVAVAFLLIGALGTGREGSPEWQAWLDGRSRSRLDAHERPVPAAVTGRSDPAPDDLRARPGTPLHR